MNIKRLLINLSYFITIVLFMLITKSYSSVEIDLNNQADKPAVLKSFARNYSHLFVTQDMEFDPHEEQELDVLIQYDKFVQYYDKLKSKGGFKEETRDFIELTVGDDNFIVSWDEQLRVFLKKIHTDAYDIKIEFIPSTTPSQKKYQLTLIRKAS